MCTTQLRLENKSSSGGQAVPGVDFLMTPQADVGPTEQSFN